MKWYLFTVACFLYSGEPSCSFDVRFEGRGFPGEAACDEAAARLGAAVADIGGRQLAYACILAPNADAAILGVLGQRRS